jgi:mannose-6-phosphate isomerase-like protein (cupin superfamily)
VIERYLIVAGSGTVEIGDLAPASVSSGDLVLIPAGVRQRIRNDGSDDLVFYAICSPRFSAGCYRGPESGDDG